LWVDSGRRDTREFERLAVGGAEVARLVDDVDRQVRRDRVEFVARRMPLLLQL
jgi:hypothetical protein